LIIADNAYKVDNLEAVNSLHAYHFVSKIRNKEYGQYYEGNYFDEKLYIHYLSVALAKDKLGPSRDHWKCQICLRVLSKITIQINNDCSLSTFQILRIISNYDKLTLRVSPCHVRNLWLAHKLY
jgi:hypothetical protein